MIFVTRLEDGEKAPVIKDSIREVNNIFPNVRIYLNDKRFLDIREQIEDIIRLLGAREVKK